MNIKMNLDNAQSQQETVKTVCEQISSGMETIKEKVIDFINDDKLKGKSYDTAKQYFLSVYLPLINGYILVSEEIVFAQNEFISQYQSKVDTNSLDSDILEDEIDKLQGLIFELDNLCWDKPFKNFYSEKIISDLKYQQKQIENKLECLLDYHSSSGDIFSEAETLLDTLKQGISELENANKWNTVTYSFHINSTSSEWATKFNDQYYKQALNDIKERLPNVTEKDLKIIQEYELLYAGKALPKDLVDTLNSLNLLLSTFGKTVENNVRFEEAKASLKKITKGTWYNSAVKSTKSGKKTWRQVNGDVKRFKGVKNAKKIDEIVNGTGTPFTTVKGVKKMTPKSVAKSVGIVGSICALLDGGTTYLERKDKYGEASAIIDGAVHTTNVVASTYIGAAIGSLIPIPIVGTAIGATVGTVVGNVLNSFWDELAHPEDNDFFSWKTLFG